MVSQGRDIDPPETAKKCGERRLDAGDDEKYFFEIKNGKLIFIGGYMGEPYEPVPVGTVFTLESE